MTVTTPKNDVAPTPRDGRAGAGSPKSTLIVFYLALGGLSFAILQSLVAPALSTIGADLDVSTGAASWVLTAYLLSAAVVTPVLARLGDMVGKRRMLIVVLSLLLGGTVVAALAPNLGVLIVARVIQGAAGAVVPLSIGVVRDQLPTDKVGVAIGLLSAIFGVGAGIGILAAGPIVENLSWQWLFWMPVGLIVIALAGVIFGVSESPVKKPGRLDLIGTGILSVALVAILLAVSEGQNWGWLSMATLGVLSLGTLALVVFVLVELRIEDPLIDMRLMKIRGVWTAHVIAMAFGFAMFGTFVLVPNLLQLPSETGYGFGRSVSEAGLFLLPTVVMMIVFGPVAGALVRRFGARTPSLVGGILIVLAFALPAIAHDALWQIIVSGVLTGAGIVLAFAAVSNAIIDSVPAVQTGEAISVNTIARTIGSSVGTAVIAALISSNSTPQGLPTDDAFTIGFWVCAGVGAIALLAALVAPSLRQIRRKAQEPGVTSPEVDGIHPE